MEMMWFPSPLLGLNTSSGLASPAPVTTKLSLRQSPSDFLPFAVAVVMAGVVVGSHRHSEIPVAMPEAQILHGIKMEPQPHACEMALCPPTPATLEASLRTPGSMSSFLEASFCSVHLQCFFGMCVLPNSAHWALHLGFSINLAI